MASEQRNTVFKEQVVVFTGKLSTLSRAEAQALVIRLGGQSADRVTRASTMLVMGEEGYVSDVVKSSKLKKAEALNAEGGAIRILAEAEFASMAGLESKTVLERKYYSLERIQRVFPRLDSDKIRYFAHWGLFKPAVRTNAEQYYEFKDLLSFRQIDELLAQNRPLREIAQRLQAQRMPSKQLAIAFDEHKPRGVVVSLQRESTAPVRTAEEWYEIGYRADGNPDTYDEAIAAYENALAMAPTYVDAMINLANLLFHRNELRRAVTLLEKALTFDPNNYLVCYNLANLCDELGDQKRAIELYRNTLSIYPDYEPAVFNLAVAFEKLGLIQQAQSYWQHYLKIEPAGEWAEIAKEHLKRV